MEKMSYRVTHISGEMEIDYPMSKFEQLLAELDHADREHLDVSVAHGSEWTLSVYGGGMVLLENVETGDSFHSDGLERNDILERMRATAKGDIDRLRASYGWLQGYPSRT